MCIFIVEFQWETVCDFCIFIDSIYHFFLFSSVPNVPPVVEVDLTTSSLGDLVQNMNDVTNREKEVQRQQVNTSNNNFTQKKLTGIPFLARFNSFSSIISINLHTHTQWLSYFVESSRRQPSSYNLDTRRCESLLGESRFHTQTVSPIHLDSLHQIFQIHSPMFNSFLRFSNPNEFKWKFFDSNQSE